MTLTPEEVDGVARYLADAEAAIDRLVGMGEDREEGRRAIDSALQAIYRAHNGLKDEPGFWERANADEAGKTMQALMYVRGRMEHVVVVDVHESTDEILLGPYTFPAENLIFGPQFWWRDWDEMLPHLDPAHGHRDKRPIVQETLPERRIADTLRTAIDYLSGELDNDKDAPHPPTGG